METSGPERHHLKLMLGILKHCTSKREGFRFDFSAKIPRTFSIRSCLGSAHLDLDVAGCLLLLVLFDLRFDVDLMLLADYVASCRSLQSSKADLQALAECG